ncbi:hypothetical protein LAZ67_X002867 [Cordylochernes scorpioides]|uniref:Uncharacterized protein n=1 Tax=Cordylochernes scorpioides TaxID=51811 RepID=A0ABY6LU59_9ARAC|nr:hypothetical protein LAZ67_X002867 [Cordylochernes scorpioides]
MSKKANSDILIFKIYVEEFNTYANQFDEICQQRNLRRLKLHHTNIAELFKTIKETYYQIVRSNALETSETLFKEYIDVKNRYENFVLQIEEILEVENVSQPVKSEQSAISNVKLPKFNLPIFSVSERQSFRNMAHFSSELESEDLIKRFWELESIPLEGFPTKEERDCESHYLKNVVRDESGRYIVRLPFKESAEKLGQSKSIAIRRFLNLEKRLEQNENIYVQYKQFMNEYIRLDHMQASCSLQTEPKYYIPHHCILKAQPNKLRVVFDASTKTTTQISLNDLLHVGPKLQNNIFSILLKFRTNSVALVADIEKIPL